MPPHGNDNCYTATTHHDDYHKDMPSSPLRSPQRLKLDAVLVPDGQDDESLITASTHAVIASSSKMTALHMPMLELEPAHPSHHDSDAASLIPVVPFDDDADDEDEDMEPMSIEDDIAEIAAGAINLSQVRHAPAFALKPQHPGTETKVYRRIEPNSPHSVPMEAEVLIDGAAVSPFHEQQLMSAMSPKSTVAQVEHLSLVPDASTTKQPAQNGNASPEQPSTLHYPMPRRSALKKSCNPPSQGQHRSGGAVSFFNTSQSNIVYGYCKIFTSTTTTTTSKTSHESSTTTIAAVRRTVKFTDLHIREYRQVLGDHPCCSSGPPVSLGWDYSPHTSISLEEYESQRIPRVTRRQLRMGCEVRREILLSSSPSSSHISDGDGEQPYTHGDFRRVERRVQRERYQRGGRRLDRNLGCFFTPPPQSLDGAAGIVTSDSE